jgi:diphthine synthase
MLSFVGLGLYDERSITLEGRDAIRSADRAFAERYTSTLAGATIDDLEAHHGVAIALRDRAGVERDPEPILDAAETGHAAFLVGGDPMVSTTHVDLRLRAHERGIETRVVHGTTARTVAGSLTGLQNYRFGKATTLPFPRSRRRASGPGDEGSDDPADAGPDDAVDDGPVGTRHDPGAVPVPDSVLGAIGENRERGLHTLVYLDIDAERERYMDASAAAGRLAAPLDDPLGVVVARAGSPKPVVAAGRLSTLADRAFGGPLHLLVVPGELHHLEATALRELAGGPAELL